MSLLLNAAIGVPEAPVVHMADYFQISGFTYSDNFHEKSFSIDCSIGKAQYGDPVKTLHLPVNVGSAKGDTFISSDPALSNIDGYYVGDYITVSRISPLRHRVLGYVGGTKTFTIEPMGSAILMGDSVRLDFIGNKGIQTGVQWIKSWTVKLTPPQVMAMMMQATTGAPFYADIKNSLYAFLTANGHIPAGF